MAVMVGLWQKNCNNNHSGQFVLPHPSFKVVLETIILMLNVVLMW